MLPRDVPAKKRPADERINWTSSFPFVIVNLLPLLTVVTGVTMRSFVLFVVCYVSRAFFITGGYHRYFAHRAYRVGRGTQLLLAIGGSSAAQKGPLWWAAHHRSHHRYADTDRDPHSPLAGFWWSHVGWFLSERYAKTDLDDIEDFAQYPELRWINRHDWVAPWALGIACFLIAGWSGLFFSFFGSTVLLWHATFSVNSFAHRRGRRRYATDDASRNNVLIAIATLGEGWHNNHHHYPRSVRQGFRWWELDVTHGILRMLGWARIAKELRTPPPAALRNRRLRDGALDLGMVRYRLSQAATAAGDCPLGRSDEVYLLLDRAAGDAGAVAGQDRVPELLSS